MVTMRDPIAVTMRALDTRGWRLPAHAPAAGGPGAYWNIVRGVSGAALRAEYAVPKEHGFSVSDITIDGEPIRYGGQIAERLIMGIDVSAMSFGGQRPALLPANGAAMRFVDVPHLMQSNEVADGADPRLVAAFPDAPTDAIPAMGRYVEPALDDQEIQGNVLAGFNKDHQWMIGFDIADVARARHWLGEIAPKLSKLADVAAYKHAYDAAKRGRREPPAPVTWLNLALSFRGLALLRPPLADGLGSPAFQQGIAARGVLPPSRQNGGEPHLLVVVAADKPTGLGDSALGDAAAIRDHAGARGLRLVFFHVGENRGGREHFGFKDGISQPAVRGTLPTHGQIPLARREIDWNGAGTDARFRDINEPELAAPGRPLVWPGEFVLGYPAQDPRHPRRPYATPGSTATPSWARNGSFAVYLRFRQDVDAFRAFVAAEAQRTGMDEERAAARLIGRWRSGAPLVSRPEGDDGVPGNHFAYADTVGSIESTGGGVTPGSAGDVRGAHCPFTAHIRKVNPRDESSDEGAAARTLKRRILRRGITYGPAWEPGSQAERGILFLAYQASLEEQFEALYRNWLADEHRPAGPGGVDLLVSGGRPGEARPFVELLEGGYFFSPAISAVRLLAREP
jgi:Dyp-type peroxidase family